MVSYKKSTASMLMAKAGFRNPLPATPIVTVPMAKTQEVAMPELKRVDANTVVTPTITTKTKAVVKKNSASRTFLNSVSLVGPARVLETTLCSRSSPPTKTRTPANAPAQHCRDAYVTASTMASLFRPAVTIPSETAGLKRDPLMVLKEHDKDRRHAAAATLVILQWLSTESVTRVRRTVTARKKVPMNSEAHLESMPRGFVA
mmetsp:Transcript_32806/g.63482  ORF Transcript_32806/g.63482 Transcript_32806/m.63482 type:complete len:203 (-) Transcript_32806:676-1284(-)